MIYRETERLVIRDFKPTDFEAVHEYSSDAENVRHMVYGPNTPEQTKYYLEVKCVEEMNAEPRMHYNFALELKSEKRVIGGISLHDNWRRDDAIFGIIINKRYAGKGYTTEALRAVVDYAFRDLGLHRVHCVCDVRNLAVQRVFEKIGLRNEGRMVRRGKSRPDEEEEYFDQYGYAILADEWLNKG